MVGTVSVPPVSWRRSLPPLRRAPRIPPGFPLPTLPVRLQAVPWVLTRPVASAGQIAETTINIRSGAPRGAPERAGALHRNAPEPPRGVPAPPSTPSGPPMTPRGHPETLEKPPRRQPAGTYFPISTLQKTSAWGGLRPPQTPPGTCRFLSVPADPVGS